jgi:hypothetical protein
MAIQMTPIRFNSGEGGAPFRSSHAASAGVQAKHGVTQFCVRCRLRPVRRARGLAGTYSLDVPVDSDNDDRQPGRKPSNRESRNVQAHRVEPRDTGSGGNSGDCNEMVFEAYRFDAGRQREALLRPAQPETVLIRASWFTKSGRSHWNFSKKCSINKP